MSDTARTAAASLQGCKVVLGGWYGATNLGDELILSVFVDWIREAGGIPSVISVHPAHTRAALGVDAADYTSLAEVAERVADSDLLVLGGGGLFQNYDVFDRKSLARFPARNVSQFAQFFLLARELGVMTAVLAQGVGPLRTVEARAITAEVFTLADVCSVRDSESANLLQDIGVQRNVPIAPDPAWASTRTQQRIDLAASFTPLAGLRVLAVVVRDWPFDADWEDAFVTALRDAIPEGWGCVWLDFSRTPSADGNRVEGGEIAYRIIPKLDDGRVHVIWNGMRIEDAAAIIASSDAMIAMRLHAALLGHLAGIPVVTLEYDDKVRVLGDELHVPGTMRFPLARIREQLAPALRVAASAGAGYRLDAGAREQLACSALAHRDLLWRAMAQARRKPVAPSIDAPLLAKWVAATPEAADRVNAAIARRSAARAQAA